MTQPASSQDRDFASVPGAAWLQEAEAAIGEKASAVLFDLDLPCWIVDALLAPHLRLYREAVERPEHDPKSEWLLRRAHFGDDLDPEVE